MNAAQRGRLIDALLQCPSMANRSGRDTIVGALRDQVKTNVQRGSGDRDDVTNLVSTCLNYFNGIEELIAVVRHWEGSESLPMQDLDYLLLDLYDYDIRPSARQAHVALLAHLSNVDLTSDELKQAYWASLSPGVQPDTEPQGLFSMARDLWNLSLRPEGRRPTPPQPVEEFVDRLAALDQGVANSLREWARKVQPELYRDEQQRQLEKDPLTAGEALVDTRTDRQLMVLSSVLSAYYPTIEDSGELVAAARLNPVKISFRESAFGNWQNILAEAQRRDKLGAILEAALAQNPDDEWLLLARREHEQKQAELSAAAEAAEPWGEVPAEAGPWERIIADPQSRRWPIVFFELCLQRAAPVVRVVRGDGGMGTAFLVGDNLLITAHHVIDSEEHAREAVVQCNYRWAANELYGKVEEYRLAPEEGFVTSPVEENNWTAVRVKGDPMSAYGAIPLTSAGGEQASTAKGDQVSIIHHPMGGPKEVSLLQTILYVGPDRIQYTRGSFPGSAGAPVFDRDWRLVAMHSAGGQVPEPGTGRVVYRGQGVRVSAIIEGLAAAGLEVG